MLIFTDAGWRRLARLPPDVSRAGRELPGADRDAVRRRADEIYDFWKRSGR